MRADGVKCHVINAAGIKPMVPASSGGPASAAHEKIPDRPADMSRSALRGFLQWDNS